ncbi:DUF1996 domain-containing protein [Sphingomonas daechungensis]|uniref:DUF1996 domain-containing protein n=1 Tax=Sphingomonas daechungensis TaxID=1176646 RepID=A0ABX6T148_9SPHN|nr:DUF1996 domain-containing protein [Sphingomonas daechungensis]QNP43124.1 DUF1996 domain-containing protein [Sphingomonas daechungensis]
MSSEFSTFKAMAIGIAIVVAGVAVAPSVTGGQYDMLRLTKPRKGKSTTDTGGTTTTTPTTTTGGTTTSPPTSTTTNSFYSELSMVPSNFDVNSELVPSWGTGAIPPSASPDVVGAFRFICNAGQLLKDDPIVYPGQPGKSHLHQFYGNTGANAYSTYSSLRASGSSTCMSPLNRSAYWMPAMLDGKGDVIRPDYLAIYYKRRPISDPKCSLSSGDPQAEGNCVPLPNGLKFIFGYDMITGKAPTGSVYFNCDGPGATQGHYPSIPAAMATCPAGAKIGAIVNAPSCWDGKNLDSANHRDHVTYKSYGSWAMPSAPTPIRTSFRTSRCRPGSRSRRATTCRSGSCLRTRCVPTCRTARPSTQTGSAGGTIPCSRCGRIIASTRS